jgi:hypothetical protein
MKTLIVIIVIELTRSDRLVLAQPYSPEVLPAARLLVTTVTESRGSRVSKTRVEACHSHFWRMGPIWGLKSINWAPWASSSNLDRKRHDTAMRPRCMLGL